MSGADRIPEGENGQAIRSELHLGLDRPTRVEREFHTLRVRAAGESRRLFQPRRLLRIISGARAEWNSEALKLCLQHRVPVVFVGGDERPLGCLQPHRARYYPLDLLLTGLLNSTGGPERLASWYRSQRRAVARKYLADNGLQPGRERGHQVLAAMDHDFRTHCAPMREQRILDRFDLTIDLVFYRFALTGKLDRALATGSVRGAGLRHYFGRLFGLEARRVLLREGLLLPDRAAAVPGFVDRALGETLKRYNGHLYASLLDLDP